MVIKDISKERDKLKNLSLSDVSNCLHEDNFPINRFGDSQCTDCGEIISHLDL